MEKQLFTLALAALTLGLLGSCKKDNGPEKPKFPEGALAGKFTVNAEGKKVIFSQGNLYYDGNTFNFETNQYDFTPSADGYWDQAHVSHFYWSATPDVASAMYYRAGGSDVFFTNADGFKVNVDGRNQTGWRTLTAAEWQYIFSDSNKYKCGVTVCGKANCIVLLPDGWEWNANTVGTSWQTEYPVESTQASPVTWQKMEDAGAVCLPAAGRRDDSNVNNISEYGGYWSSTSTGSNYAYLVDFDDLDVFPISRNYRDNGYNVRLVTNAE